MHHQDFIKVPKTDSDNDMKDEDLDEDNIDEKDDFKEKMEQLRLNEHVLGLILACMSCLPSFCLAAHRRCFPENYSISGLWNASKGRVLFTTSTTSRKPSRERIPMSREKCSMPKLVL